MGFFVWGMMGIGSFTMIKTKKYLPLLILTCLLFGQDQSVPWPVIKKTKVYKNPTEKRIKIAFKSIKKGEVIKIYNVKNNSYIKINYKYKLHLNTNSINDLFFFSILGVIIGGRIGYILLYNPSFYFSNLLRDYVPIKR